MQQTGFIGISGSGCLLPLLIILNLFFGRLIFDSLGVWLGVEATLVLIFILKIKLMFSRIFRLFEEKSSNPTSNRRRNRDYKPQGRVIDVQGQEVKDERKLE